MSLNLYTISL